LRVGKIENAYLIVPEMMIQWKGMQLHCAAKFWGIGMQMQRSEYSRADGTMEEVQLKRMQLHYTAKLYSASDKS
jgi:hypothetical protein